jgi:kynurenine formamidase
MTEKNEHVAHADPDQNAPTAPVEAFKRWPPDDLRELSVECHHVNPEIDHSRVDQDAERIFALGRELSNWGQWGDEDEKGALNYIGPAERIAAAALVRQGKVFSLALPIEDGKGPMFPRPAGRFNPVHRMTVTGLSSGPIDLGGTTDFTDDYIMMGCQSSTQWDALCHVYYDDKLYNGYPASSVGNSGAARNSIDKVATEMFGRGVLLDIAAHKSASCLEPGYGITTEDLESCAEAQGVEVKAGDTLLIRTGVMSLVSGDDWTAYDAYLRPGMHYSTASWLKGKRVAAVACDNSGVEAVGVLERLRLPFHMLVLRDMGLHLGEYWYLDDLAADCADDGVYEFLLVAQPLRIVGAAGSPINPLAIK